MSEVHEEHEHHDEHVSHTEESAWDIATDPEHFIAEMGYEALFFILSAIYLKWKLRKRDCDHGHTEVHHHHTTKVTQGPDWVDIQV